MSEREAQLGAAIARGVSFLRDRQLPHGEFVTMLGADRTMTSAVFDSSPFVTSFVVYSLAQADGAAAGDIIAKAAAFLKSEMQFGGVWRYWSSRQFKHDRLPPDIDDAACISDALRRAGVRAPKNRWAFRCARDARGRFRTWLLPTTRNRWNLWFALTRVVGFYQASLRSAHAAQPLAEDPRFRVMQIDPDDVDPVVNANAALYLGECADTVPAIEFVIEAVRDAAAAQSRYYEDSLVLDYAVARAHRHAVPRFALLRDAIVARVVARAQATAGFNVLQAALAASTLLTFDAASPLIADLLSLIIDAQRDDGGWDTYPFYNVWGSDELTSGICIEVLARARTATH